MTFTDVVTLGETMGLMKAETPGPLAQVSSLSLGMGGSESNFRHSAPPPRYLGDLGWPRRQ